ncbi:MAG: MlaD family protein [Muribaculaceae bacterium]|nr:MlaD family protein [Muribaculaceae bacterium]
MKKLFNKEFVIGLSVILAIAILIFGIEFLKGVNLFKPSNFYVVSYNNVAGLELSAPVTIDGYKVGQVREIKFNYEHPGTIEVLLAVDKSLRLPEDSKAIIESSLLSGAYINIQRGQSSKMIEVGGKLASGTAPDLMASLSGEVLPRVSSILPKVDSILSNLNRLSGDPALIQSIQRIDDITNNIAQLSANLNSTIVKNVPSLMQDARKATSNIDIITSRLADLSRELNNLPIESTMSNLSATTDDLKTFTANLNNPNSTLGRLTGDSRLYDELNQVTSDLDSLIVDIKNNPKKYISIKLL